MNIGGDRPLVRWDPKMGPQHYRTFGGEAPLTTHFRRATCKEVNCAAYENGWSFNKKVLTPGDYYKVTHAGKRYREVTIAPGETYLVFEAGQFCFDRHRMRIQRPDIFYTGRGDWRIFNRSHAKVIPTAEEFTERFGSHVELVKEVIKRG